MRMKCFSHLGFNNSEEGAHTTENPWHGISCHRARGLPWPIIAIERCSDYQTDNPFEATLSYHGISCNRLVEPSRNASVVASDQSNENDFSNLTCKNIIVIGFFMSCGHEGRRISASAYPCRTRSHGHCVEQFASSGTRSRLVSRDFSFSTVPAHCSRPQTQEH